MLMIVPTANAIRGSSSASTKRDAIRKTSPTIAKKNARPGDGNLYSLSSAPKITRTTFVALRRLVLTTVYP